MSFEPTAAPDISESIPMDVSARAELSTMYANSSLKYDVAIGGMPFMLGVSTQSPYQRQTADWRKQQIDTSAEAGEQTFDQWWTRSQDSWHRGEGINFYEPGSDAATQYRYAHGVGVDVWTKGQVTLLHAMDKVASVSAGQSAFVTTGKSGSYFAVENGTVQRYDGVATAFTGLTTASCPVVLAGSTLLVGAGDGIYSGAASGSTLTKLYSSTAPIRPWWVKSRIVAAVGRDLFELPLTVDTPPGTLGTAFYSHPLAGWTWTAVADAPTAILAAGSDDGHSVIYRFALEDAGSGSTPTLGQAYQVAEFPPGETVTSLAVYLGQYVGIGTTRGIRIGVVDTDGSIQYGPLIVETDEPVLDMEGRGSFIYAAVSRAIDGSSGAVRINLGEGGLESDSLRFAYAWDAQTHTAGDCKSLGFVGGTDRVVLGVTGEGIYAQSATQYESAGYITSGRIRYATSELKAFRQVRISARAAASGEGVRIFVRDQDDVESFVVRLTSDSGTTQNITLSQAAAMSNASIRLQLEPSTDGQASPRLDAMLVKAVPAISRQRLISIPIQIFDRESDRYNASFMREGFAAKRLFALEELESSHATVSVQDFTADESFEAQIEQINFTRTSAPSKARSGFGGVATVVVRKLI